MPRMWQEGSVHGTLYTSVPPSLTIAHCKGFQDLMPFIFFQVFTAGQQNAPKLKDAIIISHFVNQEFSRTHVVDSSAPRGIHYSQW